MSLSLVSQFFGSNENTKTNNDDVSFRRGSAASLTFDPPREYESPTPGESHDDHKTNDNKNFSDYQDSGVQTNLTKCDTSQDGSSQTIDFFELEENDKKDENVIAYLVGRMISSDIANRRPLLPAFIVNQQTFIKFEVFYKFDGDILKDNFGNSYKFSFKMSNNSYSSLSIGELK
jgi:hypothetical protein